MLIFCSFGIIIRLDLHLHAQTMQFALKGFLDKVNWKQNLENLATKTKVTFE